MIFHLRATRKEYEFKEMPEELTRYARQAWFYNIPVFLQKDGQFIVDFQHEDLDDTLCDLAALGLWHAQKVGKDFADFTYTLEIHNDNPKKQFMSPIMSWAAGLHLIQEKRYQPKAGHYQGEMVFVWQYGHIWRSWRDISLDESLAQIYEDIADGVRGYRKGISTPTYVEGCGFPELIRNTAVERIRNHMSWAESNLQLVRNPI